MKRPAVLLAAAIIVLATAAIPDVRYVRETKFKIAGQVGQALSAAQSLLGIGFEQTETVSISGSRMRTDRDKTSTIVDLDAETVTELDHKKKEYVVRTFAEYRALIDENIHNARDAMDQGRVESGSVSIETEFSVEPTGETRAILGQVASRYLITFTMTSTAGPEQPDGTATVVYVSDSWQVPEMPGGEEEAEFNRRYAAKMWADGAPEIQEFALQYMSMGAADHTQGMKRVAEEMAKLDGFPVDVTTYVVRVPEGVEFDRDAVVNPATEENKSPGMLGALMRRAAEEAVRRATDQRGSPVPAGNPAGKPAQQVDMTISNRTIEASAAPLPGDLFTVPGRYSRAGGG